MQIDADACSLYAHSPVLSQLDAKTKKRFEKESKQKMKTLDKKRTKSTKSKVRRDVGLSRARRETLLCVKRITSPISTHHPLPSNICHGRIFPLLDCRWTISNHVSQRSTKRGGSAQVQITPYLKKTSLLSLEKSTHSPSPSLSRQKDFLSSKNRTRGIGMIADTY